MSSAESVRFIDGISSIATHNGVHRIIFYKLSAEQRPEPSVELIIPDSSMHGIVEAMRQGYRTVRAA